MRLARAPGVGAGLSDELAAAGARRAPGVGAGDPDPFAEVALTHRQQQRVEVMRGVAQEVSARYGDNFVLKGGTALMLLYGSPRFSEDLDFDGRRQRTDPAAGVVRGAQRVRAVEGLRAGKSTPTSRKYYLTYEGGCSRPLKVEFSYRRAADIDEADVVRRDGIRVYGLTRLASLKIDAFVHRTRARDVFDVGFLLSRHPEAVDEADVIRVREHVDVRGIDNLLEEVEDDDALAVYDATGIALGLMSALADRPR